MSSDTDAEMRALVTARLVCDQVMQRMRRDIEARAHPADAAKFSRLMQLAFEYAATIGAKAMLDELRP